MPEIAQRRIKVSNVERLQTKTSILNSCLIFNCVNQIIFLRNDLSYIFLISQRNSHAKYRTRSNLMILLVKN